MGDHYYSERPTSKSNRKQITVNIRGKTYYFLVDRGVFSKGGLDFGTRLLIESFRAPDVEGLIGDVGCGWGPIGITLASEYNDKKIVMVDINERAVELAKRNARNNNVKNVDIFQNDLLTGFENETFSALAVNPPIRAGKKVVFQLYEQAKNVLVQGGELWIVIQKKQGAPSTKKKLEHLGFKVVVVNRAKGYFVIKGINP